MVLMTPKRSSTDDIWTNEVGESNLRSILERRGFKMQTSPNRASGHRKLLMPRIGSHEKDTERGRKSKSKLERWLNEGDTGGMELEMSQKSKEEVLKKMRC